MRLSVEGTLVVPMTVVVNDKPVKCKTIKLEDISTGQMFEARANAKAGEYVVINELASRATLIDDKGVEHQVTYQMLHDTSASNYRKLEELDAELQAKLNAESLESQSD